MLSRLVNADLSLKALPAPMAVEPKTIDHIDVLDVATKLKNLAAAWKSAAAKQRKAKPKEKVVGNINLPRFPMQATMRDSDDD